MITEQDLINKKKVTVWESIKHALLTWDKAILTSLLAAIILIGLFILLIIPGIIYQTYYSFILFAVILKGKKYKKALDYSKSLVKGRWWRVFGTLLIVSIGISLVAGIASMIISIYESYITYVIADSVFDVIYALRDVFLVVFFINLANVGPKKK